MTPYTYLYFYSYLLPLPEVEVMRSFDVCVCLCMKPCAINNSKNTVRRIINFSEIVYIDSGKKPINFGNNPL
jgi:hypothetical protein